MAYEANADFARVYGDIGTGVWIAPKGTTLPTDLTVDPAGFKPLGWLHDDGIDFDVEKDITEFNALQGGTLIRKKVGKVVNTFKFQCLEETALVLGLVHADAPINVTGGVARINIGDNQNRTVERSVVIDVVDGSFIKRYAISAADLTFQGTIKLSSNEDIAGYEFECAMLGGAAAELITNSPGVVANATP